MSIADAIAFCGLMVAIISVSGILLEAYNRRLRHREKTLEMEVRLAEADGRTREAGVPQMEERLRVLERIATDRKTGLADEIEALRLEKEPAQ